MKRSLLLLALVFSLTAWVAGAAEGTGAPTHHAEGTGAPTHHADAPTPAGHINHDNHDLTEGVHDNVSMDLGVVILCGILIVSWVLESVIHQYHLPIPEGALPITLGVLIGGIDFMSGHKVTSLISFNTHIFQLFLLPPIIFDAGFSLRKKGFVRNAGTILLLAVVGTLISSMIIGMITWAYLGNAHGVNSALEAMMFGSLMSAIDPVASLAVFAKIFGVDKTKVQPNPLLYNLVFGESVMNDAVCIVLYKSLQAFLYTPWVSEAPLLIIGKFVLVFFASAGIGISIGFITALLFKYSALRGNTTFEIFVVFIMSYASFVGCEAFHLSGITAIFVCGMCQSHYTWFNLSEEGQMLLPRVFSALATVCETLVFAYLGMAFFAFEEKHSWNAGFICLLLPVCLFARAVGTFPLVALANIRRSIKISFKQAIVMWFSGLRGAIAFALAVDMTQIAWTDDPKIAPPPPPPGSHASGNGTPESAMFVSTTLVIVAVTTAMCGVLTGPMLKCLGLDKVVVDRNEQEKSSEKVTSWDRRFIKPCLIMPEVVAELRAQKAASGAAQSDAVTQAHPTMQAAV